MTFARPPRPPDLDAVIGALPVADGGRSGPMTSGYRAAHDFGRSDELNDAMHEYLDQGQIAQGETGRALLWLLAPERQFGRLFSGMLFRVQEGTQVVGDDCVVRVLNEGLRREHPIRLEIDGTRGGSLEEFYDEVGRVLIPLVSWSRNLDAFNDILRGGFGTPDDGFTLVWREHLYSREKLGHAETARQLEHRLARCHPTNRPDVAVDLANARAGIGPTVFDWLVEIVLRHGQEGEESSDRVELVLA
jgi:hypothetical protein